MGTRRIAIGDVELGYDELPGEGRALVLLHGFTGHRADFAHRLTDLRDVGRVLVPDLRGHGDFSRTGRPETFRFEQLLADLDALLDAWGLPDCDLLGHSFGGMVALRYALARPGRVASLVLMSTSPAAPTGYALATFEKAGAIARARGMAFLQELVEKAWRANPEPGPSDRQTRKWAELYWPHHRRRYVAMDPEAYGALGRLMVQQEPLGAAELARIRCPTTILVGDEDPEFLDGAERLEAGIAHAVRVTLRDAGHHPHMESPEAWLDALRAHMARARAAPAPPDRP